MADIELVIKIPEKTVNEIKDNAMFAGSIPSDIRWDVTSAIVNGIPLEQESKTGHWNCGDDMFEYAICSSYKHETGEAWEYAKRNFKYCPNCGAKMQ